MAEATRIIEPKLAVLDTVNDVVSGRNFYTRMMWYGGDGTNQLTLKNANGDTLFDITLTNAHDAFEIKHLEKVWIDGLIVTVIGGGAVYAQYE